ncbi:MAG TPA: hypothetical protein ENI15_05630 [Spirochaetes bacterium]|nr:hypothetical protein [Spirochaetota bacterium]
MKKSEPYRMYFTGIREIGSSKQTMISVISGLKTHLDEKIYTVTGPELSISTFNDVVNRDGGLYLSGPEIKGSSLYELYQDFQANTFLSGSVTKYFHIFRELIKAEEVLLSKTGLYHPLILNSILYNTENNTFIFLPIKLIDFLNKYRDPDLQSILYFCFEHKPDMLTSDESVFSESLARLVYMHFIKMRKDKKGSLRPEPVFYLSDLIDDVPCFFSDVLWEVMRGKNTGLNRIVKLIDETLGGKYSEGQSGFPVWKKIFRNSSLIIFFSSLSELFERRKKLIILAIILTGIAAYMFRGYLSENRKIDYTAGLNAGQVVELYYKAVNDLDLEIVDYVFYKRAGRKIKNELGSLYVILKMRQIYGQGPAVAEELNSGNDESQSEKTYYLKDFEISESGDNETSIFFVKYTKVLNTGEEITVYSIKETLYLKEYLDHWYIIEINRIIDQSNAP